MAIALLCALLGVAALQWAWHLYPPSPRGLGLALVDATWSLPNTVAGLLFLLFALARGNAIDRGFTRHRGIIGLRHGVIPGFATTIGPVQAGLSPGLNRHEAIHVLQARLFGPCYLPLVLLNWVVATVLPYWLLYHDRAAEPITSVAAYFRHGVYPHCWHEEWAYRRCK
jgi:hypothetical protein